MNQINHTSDTELAILRERVRQLEEERQSLNSALVESEARFQAFLDHSPAVAFMKDEQGRYVYWNRQMETTLGVVQLNGKTDQDVFPPAVAQELRAHDARALEQDRAVQVTETVPVNGQPRTWLVAKFPFQAGGGRRYLGGVGIDVTERQRAEARLNEHEIWLRNLIVNIPGPVFRCGYAPNWTIHYISDAIEAISGYPASDFIHDQVRPYTSIIHPADWPATERRAMEAVAQRKPYAVEYRILHRQGGVRWIHERGQAVFGPDGAILYLDGVLLDITERKQAEDELRRQAQILSQSHEAVIITDLQGIIQEWNQGAVRLFGYRPEEAIGKHVSLLHEPEDAAAFAQRIREPLLREGSLETDCWRRRKNGEQVYVHLTLSLLRGPGGQPTGMIGSSIDITARWRMEEKLRQSEEFHRQIADLSYDYAYSCTVDDQGAARLESVTEGFTRVTGYTLEEIKAAGDWVALIHPEDLVQAVGANPFSQEREIHELRIVTRNKTIRWIRFSTHPMRDANGRVHRLIGAVHDITDQKRAEHQLREYADKHQSLSRRLLEVQEEERRHLARELHDEIGQELTGLQFALEMGECTQAMDLSSCLAKARQMVKDLMVRVRELSMGLRPTLLDDMGLFPALRWLIQRYNKQTGIVVHFKQEGRERRLLPALETAAYRIVQEALTNVARHANTREAWVQLQLDDDRLRIQVEDHGAGFVLQQARRDTSGLSGMHERAGLLHGQLHIDSSPGKGTRLTVDIPLPEQPQ